MTFAAFEPGLTAFGHRRAWWDIRVLTSLAVAELSGQAFKNINDVESSSGMVLKEQIQSWNVSEQKYKANFYYQPSVNSPRRQACYLQHCLSWTVKRVQNMLC